MDTEEFLLPRSRLANERLHTLIPGGAHTYAKGDDQYPENLAPVISHGNGAHVWDIDGNRYVEYGSGLRSVSLGHAHPRVNEAVRRQLDRGSNFVRPSIVEVEAAERFLATVPTADMVKFAKNGSDVTTAAVRLARAATGRPRIAICGDHPFLSADDWFIGTTPMSAGCSGGDHRAHRHVPLRGPGRHGGTAHPVPRRGRLSDPRTRHPHRAAARIPRRSARAGRPARLRTGLRRDDHRPALVRGGRPGPVRGRPRPLHVRQGAGQRVRRLRAGRAPRPHGTGRAAPLPRPGVPAVHHPRRGNTLAGRRDGRAHHLCRGGRHRAAARPRRAIGRRCPRGRGRYGGRRPHRRPGPGQQSGLRHPRREPAAVTAVPHPVPACGSSRAGCSPRRSW